MKILDKHWNYVHDNLGLITLIMESRHNGSLRQIHFGKDGKINFYFKNEEVEMAQDQIVQEMERIKPDFLNLVRRIYEKDIRSVELDGDDIRLGYSDEPLSIVVKKDDLCDYVRNGCRLIIETKCTVHDIPLHNEELLECATLEELITAYKQLENGISRYCPNGKQPSTPVSFDIDVVEGTQEIGAELAEIPLFDAGKDPELRQVYKRLF